MHTTYLKEFWILFFPVRSMTQQLRNIFCFNFFFVKNFMRTMMTFWFSLQIEMLLLPHILPFSLLIDFWYKNEDNLVLWKCQSSTFKLDEDKNEEKKRSNLLLLSRREHKILLFKSHFPLFIRDENYIFLLFHPHTLLNVAGRKRERVRDRNLFRYYQTIEKRQLCVRWRYK
jgi:hypothetical protein